MAREKSICQLLKTTLKTKNRLAAISSMDHPTGDLTPCSTLLNSSMMAQRLALRRQTSLLFRICTIETSRCDLKSKYRITTLFFKKKSWSSKKKSSSSDSTSETCLSTLKIKLSTRASLTQLNSEMKPLRLANSFKQIRTCSKMHAKSADALLARDRHWFNSRRSLARET